MLLIRAAAGQTITVGEHGVLTVLAIDEEHKEVTVTYSDKGYTECTLGLEAGKSITLRKHVTLVVTRIMLDTAVRAELGFEAPISVRIKGDWFGSRTAAAVKPSMPFHSMTTDELIHHTDVVKLTPLEAELVLRLAKLQMKHNVILTKLSATDTKLKQVHEILQRIPRQEK